MPLESKKEVIKLVSVLAISMPVTTTREEMLETAETAKIIEIVAAREGGEESKGDKYPRNLI